MNAQVDRLEALLLRVQGNRRRGRGGHVPSGTQAQHAAETAVYPEGVHASWADASASGSEESHPSFAEVGSDDSASLSAPSELTVDIDLSSVEMVTIPPTEGVLPEAPAAKPDSLFPNYPGDMRDSEPPMAQALLRASQPPEISPFEPMVSGPPKSADSLFPEAPVTSLRPADDGIPRVPLALAKAGPASGPIARVVGQSTQAWPATFGELVQKALALRVR